MTHKVRTLLLFCSLALFLSIIIVGPASAINDDAWADDMTDWGYRVPITITDAPTAAGVQRMITLTYQDEMQADFDDIRFYTASGDSIDYWIEEKTDSTSADVWVKLPAADMLYIYAYYGNASAISTGNPESTFLLYDDFSGNSLNTSKWDIINNNGISVSNGIFAISSGGNSYGTIRSLSSIGPSTHTIIKLSTHTYFSALGFGASDYSGEGSSIGWATRSGYESAIYTGASSGGWIPPRAIGKTLTGGTIIPNMPAGYHTEEFIVPSGDKLKHRRDGGTWTTSSIYDGITSAAPVEIKHCRAYGGLSIDSIIINKYNPKLSTFEIGNSEQAPAPNAIPYPGYTNFPTDQNGDGLYEDVNGNNRLDFQDIMIFFQYNAWAAAHQNNSYFDWSGNGVIEFSDVQLFWEKEFT